MGDYINNVFGPGGLLAQKFPAYEMRPGQVQMAQAVDRAFAGGHLVCEGPCGIGKSLAYLVPAIHHALSTNDRVVVATANIALQEQLVKKDLPLLASILPEPFTFHLMKGRSNFLCPYHMHHALKEGVLNKLKPEQLDQANQIIAWAKDTKTGDRAELYFEPEGWVWSLFTAGMDDCLGPRCPNAEDCGYLASKECAQYSNIVITNQHMLFAHVNVRMSTGDDMVLPPFKYVVIDEAHEAADIAREFFGFTTSKRGISRLARNLSRADKSYDQLATDLNYEAAQFFDQVKDYANSGSYKNYLRRPDWVNANALVDTLQDVLRTAAEMELTACGRTLMAKWGAVRRGAARHRDAIVAAVKLNDSNVVCWLEKTGAVHGKLLNVSSVLQENLFGMATSVVLTSATLAVGGWCLDFIRDELGVPPAAQGLVVDTPFDFWSRTRFVVPKEAVDPRVQEFPAVSADILRRLITLAGGRTLGLFTSYKNLNEVANRLGVLPQKVMKQKDAPRTVLADAFRKDETSVLLGTDSFWMGLDVPGDSLVALFIDKLPFPNMSDPMIAAFNDRSPDAFFRQMLPRAVVMFRQGVGRLIRTATDYGLIVVADQRLTEKAYGQSFLTSLPRMRSTDDLDAAGKEYETWRAPISAP